MSDSWNPHEIPPDPWLNPVWEDPDFIAENGIPDAPAAKLDDKERLASALPPRPMPEELAAFADAEATLGELRGALRTVPREIATGVVKRLALKEACGYLHIAAQWIHPADLALREIGAVSGVLAAIRAERPRAALPVTLSARGMATERDDEWAMTLDRHAEDGISFARLTTRMALATLDRPDERTATERLGIAGSEEDIDPLDMGQYWKVFSIPLASGHSGTHEPTTWTCHEIGRAWRVAEGPSGDDDSRAVARLALCLSAHYRKRRPGPWLLPWLCRLPQRYRHPSTALSLFIDAPDKRLAWLGAVREAALEGIATLRAVQEARDIADAAKNMRETELLKRIAAQALADAVITTHSAAKACDVAPQSALMVLLRLERIGMLREITGRERFRVWTCGF